MCGAAQDCDLSDEQVTKLWAKLADSSSQRIIGGATAPREDASNVNNWHWAEQDLAPWCKERLTELIVGLAAKGVPDKGWVKVTKLESCEGEASVSNRKGKRIVAYELKVKCEWKGSVDYDEFLKVVRGRMPPLRRKLVGMVFRRIDQLARKGGKGQGDGLLTADDLIGAFSGKDHPDVRAG